MRHYEIVILIHPDQSDQVPDMIQRYRSIVTDSGSKIFREEDWGRRQLTHTISKTHKAHYILLNIECDLNILDELVSAFRFNDAVLRHIVIKRDKPITEPSLIAKIKETDDKEELARSSSVDEKDDKTNSGAGLSNTSPDDSEKDSPDDSEKDSPDDSEKDSPDDAKSESIDDSQKEDGSD